ncbi:hypothetical protein E4U10_003348 [Claviceps purpurea]|nr:hypothetical protein E4U10_003348 [Claviceps purpurea]
MLQPRAGPWKQPGWSEQQSTKFAAQLPLGYRAVTRTTQVEVLRATDADTRVLATSPKVEAVQLDGLSVFFNGVMWISSYFLA